jgi:hypothetical protein
MMMMMMRMDYHRPLQDPHQVLGRHQRHPRGRQHQPRYPILLLLLFLHLLPLHDHKHRNVRIRITDHFRPNGDKKKEGPGQKRSLNNNVRNLNSEKNFVLTLSG